MASIKYKTSEGYTSIPMNIIGSRIYLEDYDDGEVIPELVDDNAKLGNGIGTCSTSTGTALEVTLANYKLVKNGIVAITFENDVPANATLNINNKGAKPIYNEGSAIEADVIKAGKTVMFAYDGTNYVVTSLGGETGEDGEIVVVRCSASDDASVAGKTVTINGTQYTLDATGIVSTKIPFGTQYSVVAGSWTGYITPTTQTFTAGVILREINMEWEFGDKSVDLGLPSGRKWAEANVGATNAWEIGLYFSWGNVIGHAENSGYNFDQATYNSTPGAALTGDIAVGTTYDAARAIMGGSWRMPTKDEFQELYDNTDTEWVADYHGIAGRKFMKKTDHNVFIFFPAAGSYYGTTLDNRGSRGYYWSSSIYSDVTISYRLNFYSDGVLPQSNNGRVLGQPIRAVQ